jgi:hypothetical protein
MWIIERIKHDEVERFKDELSAPLGDESPDEPDQQTIDAEMAAFNQFGSQAQKMNSMK